MSFFGGSGQVGGRGTWIQSPSTDGESAGRRRRSSWDLATSNSVSPSKIPMSEQQRPTSMASWQQRMASLQQGGVGSLTGSTYKPHSPPSSPPRTDEWDNVDNNNDESKSPHEKHLNHPDEGITKCICNRSFTEIACVSCGMLFEGRVRTPCPRHPNTIHLMDMDRCPVCRATNLVEVHRMTATATTRTPVKSEMMQQSRPH